MFQCDIDTAGHFEMKAMERAAHGANRDVSQGDNFPASITRRESDSFLDSIAYRQDSWKSTASSTRRGSSTKALAVVGLDYSEPAPTT